MAEKTPKEIILQGRFTQTQRKSLEGALEKIKPYEVFTARILQQTNGTLTLLEINEKVKGITPVLNEVQIGISSLVFINEEDEEEEIFTNGKVRCFISSADIDGSFNPCSLSIGMRDGNTIEIANVTPAGLYQNGMDVSVRIEVYN